MGYTAYRYINITVDVMGCLVILTLIASQFINRSGQNAKSRVFVLLLIAAFLSIFCEFLSWIILDLSNPVLWNIYAAVNLFGFFIQGCVLGLYMLYIYLYVEARPKEAFLLTCVCFTAIALYMLTIIAPPFSGMRYSIHPETGDQWGTYYALGPICTFTARVCAAGVILLNGRMLGVRRTIMLSGYIILLVITVPVHLLNPDIPVPLPLCL